MASIITTPQYQRPNSVSISPFSYEAQGGAISYLTANAMASAVWPTTNLAILYPFRVLIPFTIASLYVANGAAVSGNFDIGIYDDGGGSSTINRLVSLGSTAQAGTSAPQATAAAYTLLPGNYYAALCFDNTTATTQSRAVGTGALMGALGYAQVANGAVTLGATLSLALCTTGYIPLFGPSQKAAV